MNTMYRPLATLLAAAASCAALAQDLPFARHDTPPPTLVDGRYNGIDLEQRSGCANAVNNGSHGTYAQFDVGMIETGDFSITQTGITGLNCSYSGRWSTADGTLSVQGDYKCTDGKVGTFRTRQVNANGMLLTMLMDIQLSGSETCSINGLLSMARFYP
jgi:hypothetical protein